MRGVPPQRVPRRRSLRHDARSSIDRNVRRRSSELAPSNATALRRCRITRGGQAGGAGGTGSAGWAGMAGGAGWPDGRHVAAGIARRRGDLVDERPRRRDLRSADSPSRSIARRARRPATTTEEPRIDERSNVEPRTTHDDDAPRLFALRLDEVLVAIDAGQRGDVGVRPVGQDRRVADRRARPRSGSPRSRARGRAGSSGTRARRTSTPRASESTSARPARRPAPRAPPAMRRGRTSQRCSSAWRSGA